MNSCAPVVITVYDRYEHFVKCLESLQACTLSEETPIYIGIDYPKCSRAVNKQYLIINYLKKCSGFKYIKIIKHEKNIGARNNAKKTIATALKKYDKFIRTEDDNIFSPFFLETMNYYLVALKKNRDVFAICGYNYPRTFKVTGENILFLAREFYPWGWATWKDRYDDFELKYFDALLYLINPISFYRLVKHAHLKVIKGLVTGYLDGKYFTDYMYTIYVNKKNRRCLMPRQSIVRNIGQDSSGLNSGHVQEMLNQEIFIENKFRFAGSSDELLFEHENSRDVFFDFNLDKGKNLPSVLFYFLIVILFFYDFFRRK